MDLLRTKSVRFGHFKLASGKESNVYVDCKLTTYSAEAIPLVGRAFLRRIKANGWLPQAVGGLTLGADPIAFAIARESLETDKPIHAFIVRKETKKHGMGRFIAGLEETQGCRVVLLDYRLDLADSTRGLEIACPAVGLGADLLLTGSGRDGLLQSKFDCSLRVYSSCRISKPTRMNLRPLRELLNQPYSNAVCSAILHHTSIFYREPGRIAGFRCFSIEYPRRSWRTELIHADTTEPVLEVVALQASRG
jgi:orotate phosphoribosyltransferase